MRLGDKLVRLYEPNSAQRQITLMQTVLAPRFRDDPSHFMEDLLLWEEDVTRYARATGAALPDAVLVGILLQRAPAGVRTYLTIHSGTVGQSYAQARAAIESFVQSSKVWAPTSASSSFGPTPMDVDVVSKGKGGSRL